MAKRPPRPALAARVLSRSSYPEYLRISEILRLETVGGALLLVATAAALIWANSPAAAGYFALRDLKIGYEPWHLQLSLGHWASDGLLAVFFLLPAWNSNASLSPVNCATCPKPWSPWRRPWAASQFPPWSTRC